jgi:hypothetical protein
MTISLLHGVILGVAIMITMLCIYGVLSPRSLTNWLVGFWPKPYAMPMAIIGRLVLGVVFILAAETSRFPDFFTIVGGLSIAAAVLIPIVGKEKVGKVIAWGGEQSPMVMRLWCLFGVMIGLLLGYGVM